MEQFTIFGLVALIAVCFKVLILFQVRATSQLNTAFVVACLALILQNALEFCGYISYARNPDSATPFLHGLIIALYMVCGSMVYLCAAVAGSRRTVSIGYVCAGAVAVLTLLHLLGLSVVDFQQTGYTIVSVPGPAYVLFQLFAPACALACLALLARGALSSESSVLKRSRLALIAVLPLCMVGIAVTIIRAMGYNSSTAIVMPTASTFLVWVLMYEARGDIVAVKLKWRFILSIIKYAKDTSIDEWPELTDRIQLIEAMRMCDNKKGQVAKMLKTSPSTITRKCEKYGIEKGKVATKVATSPMPGKIQQL